MREFCQEDSQERRYNQHMDEKLGRARNIIRLKLLPKPYLITAPGKISKNFGCSWVPRLLLRYFNNYFVKYAS